MWVADRSGGARLARSLVALVREVDARWPDRDRTSDGSIGDRAHSARTSDHNPDAGGVVRAVDVDDDDARPEVEGIGRVIAEHLRATRDRRVKYLIYQGRMCSSYPAGGHPAWAWRPYVGVNAHMQHLHVSVHPGAVGDDESSWGVALSTRPEEDPLAALSDQEQRRVLAAADALPGIAARLAEMQVEAGKQGVLLDRHIGPALRHIEEALARLVGALGAVEQRVDRAEEDAAEALGRATGRIQP